MDGLKMQLSKEQLKNPQRRWDRYSGTSDKDGRLTISNLPRNRISTHLSASGGMPKMTLANNDRPAGKLPESDQSEVEIELVVAPGEDQ
jgi:hypothetical protein